MNINEYMEKFKETEGALLIDLRNPEDFQRSHIPGAVNILPDQLRDEIRRLATFRTPIYLYCYAGARSAQAEGMLTAKGYKAYNIGSFEEYTGEREGKAVRMQMKQLRKERGISQVQMAESIGVKPVTISAIETARMKISAKIAERVRAVYDVEIEDTDTAAQTGKEETPARKPAGKRKTAGRGRKRIQNKEPAAVVYQDASGRQITEAEILAKVGKADRICVILDENRAEWTRGKESGSVELW